MNGANFVGREKVNLYQFDTITEFLFLRYKVAQRVNLGKPSMKKNGIFNDIDQNNILPHPP